ncbi:nitrile hydratase subunit alpha [Pendulispora albinea]|uniref:nitrile hydratase n=1 Tax=Pendulispora albinea TaxID=2741071 RepID=A0ABZ2M5U3_9BACT
MSGDHPHGEQDHGHGHGHEGSATMASRVAGLVEKLAHKGLVTEEQIDAAIVTFLAKAGPSNGAALVARAWVDPAFKARLLQDGNAALDELGLDMSHWARVTLRAVENTEHVHNVIVCTLCSCYPIALLGPSPSWYKSLAYRARVVRDPRGVLAEFGVELDPRTEIRVWDSTAELRYVVIPRRPAGTQTWTEDELGAAVTRDALIGTAVL